MAYFIVSGGAIDRSFPTKREAEAYAAEHGNVRVIGDEWITLGEAKDRVERAAAAIEEVSPMLDAARVDELRTHLRELEDMLDRALASLGLDPG